MKDKIKNYSIQFIKNIIPVVVGILIALFIDNWNVERKDRIYIDQVFSTIHSELDESKEEINYTMPLQKTLITTLETYTTDQEATIMDVVIKAKGIYIPQIKLSAWKAVSNSKIDLIDYDKVTALSNIEELKKMLEKKSEFLMTYLYTNINATDKNTKLTFKMILLDIIQTENTLIKNIEAFKENNKKN